MIGELDQAIVLQVEYRPGKAPAAIVKAKLLRFVDDFHQPVYGDAEKLEFEGDAARAIAREYLCPGARWA